MCRINLVQWEIGWDIVSSFEKDKNQDRYQDSRTLILLSENDFEEDFSLRIGFEAISRGTECKESLEDTWDVMESSWITQFRVVERLKRHLQRLFWHSWGEIGWFSRNRQHWDFQGLDHIVTRFRFGLGRYLKHRRCMGSFGRWNTNILGFGLKRNSTLITSKLARIVAKEGLNHRARSKSHSSQKRVEKYD